MDKGFLKISLINLFIESSDGFRYPLSKRFFNLYVYLAYQRLANNRENGGFVELEKIRHLPLWEKNSLESVGKQIRRHTSAMEKVKKNIIEAKQKIKGPLRLTLEPNKISFDVDDQAIKEYLGLDKLAVFYAGVREEDFFKYIDALIYGDIYFNEGSLTKAARRFQQATEQGTTFQQKVVAMQRLGRTYERLGNYDEAFKIHRAAIRILKKGTRPDYYNLALTYTNLAWLYFRKGAFDSAKKTYYLALDVIRGKMHNDLLGKINNGLGILYDLQGKYEEANSYFKNALALSCFESDCYSVSATYFNISVISIRRRRMKLLIVKRS